MGRQSRHLEPLQEKSEDMPEERIYQPLAASELLGISKSHLFRLVAEDPDFPPPRKMGKKVVFWLRSELLQYVRSRPFTRSAEVHKLKLAKQS
jgi:predicted DNA-binding transcriptional regulator AlpA